MLHPFLIWIFILVLQDLSTASQKKDSQVTSKNDSVEDVSQVTEESPKLLEEEDDDASEVVLRKRIGAPPNIPTASSPSADVVNSSIHMSLSINPVVEPEKSNKVSKPCRKE